MSLWGAKKVDMSDAAAFRKTFVTEPKLNLELEFAEVGADLCASGFRAKLRTRGSGTFTRESKTHLCVTDNAEGLLKRRAGYQRKDIDWGRLVPVKAETCKSGYSVKLRDAKKDTSFCVSAMTRPLDPQRTSKWVCAVPAILDGATLGIASAIFNHREEVFYTSTCLKWAEERPAIKAKPAPPVKTNK